MLLPTLLFVPILLFVQFERAAQYCRDAVQRQAQSGPTPCKKRCKRNPSVSYFVLSHTEDWYVLVIVFSLVEIIGMLTDVLSHRRAWFLARPP